MDGPRDLIIVNSATLSFFDQGHTPGSLQYTPYHEDVNNIQRPRMLTEFILRAFYMFYNRLPGVHQLYHGRVQTLVLFLSATAQVSTRRPWFQPVFMEKC